MLQTLCVCDCKAHKYDYLLIPLKRSLVVNDSWRNAWLPPVWLGPSPTAVFNYYLFKLGKSVMNKLLFTMTAYPGQTRTTLGQLCATLWDSQSRPDVIQPGFKPGTVVTPLALRCSASDQSNQSYCSYKWFDVILSVANDLEPSWMGTSIITLWQHPRDLNFRALPLDLAVK